MVITARNGKAVVVFTNRAAFDERMSDPRMAGFKIADDRFGMPSIQEAACSMHPGVVFDAIGLPCVVNAYGAVIRLFAVESEYTLESSAPEGLQAEFDALCAERRAASGVPSVLDIPEVPEQLRVA